MVGGPVFGKPSRLRRAAFSIVVFSIVLFVVWMLVGCASPKIEYRPIPAMLVPAAPDLPKITAAELSCLSDDAYLKLATRDRTLRRYADELRALLEPSP